MRQQSKNEGAHSPLMRISYRLLPSPEESDKFAGMIALFAEFDGPTFMPHLTLYSGLGAGRCKLDNILKEAVSNEGDLHPHLSLFYGKLTAGQRQKVRKIFGAPKTVRFDRLAAVAMSETISNFRDVLSWRGSGRSKVVAGKISRL